MDEGNSHQLWGRPKSLDTHPKSAIDHMMFAIRIISARISISVQPKNFYILFFKTKTVRKKKNPNLNFYFLQSSHVKKKKNKIVVNKKQIK